MPRKRSNVNFDETVKSFMQYYNIPTKQDFAQLVERLDRIEKMLRQVSGNGRPVRGGEGGRSSRAASGQVLEMIRAAEGSIDFRDIRSKTGYDDKKLRNIIFRLNKLGKIRRVSRGLYEAVSGE